MNSEKYDLRVKCKAIRKTLDTQTVSSRICNLIKNWSIFKNAQNVMLFYPVGTEVSLLDLLQEKGKNFYFPQVAGNQLYALQYTTMNNFQKGEFNIPEPSGKSIIDCSFIELVLVPALAADTTGNRLGYGKGYYDRFLNSYPGIISAVPVCSKLLFNSIPTDKHDVRVNYIITENDIIHP